MLTPRQAQLLSFIHQSQHKSGITPSYDEMRVALNIASKSGIHQLITGLIERGYLEKFPNRSRAINIIKLPEILANSTLSLLSKSVPETTPEAGLEAGHSAKTPHHSSTEESENTLPFLGKIAAGLAIEAIEYADESWEVPKNMVGKGTHFVLEINGDSMIDVGILDGDHVIIRQQNTANNGEIVVACIDNEEVTLKRLQRRNNSVALQPENREYTAQIYSADRVSIKGVLCGLMRQYS